MYVKWMYILIFVYTHKDITKIYVLRTYNKCNYSIYNSRYVNKHFVLAYLLVE